MIRDQLRALGFLISDIAVGILSALRALLPSLLFVFTFVALGLFVFVLFGLALFWANDCLYGDPEFGPCPAFNEQG